MSFNNFELDCTSFSDIQYAQSTQAAVIYGTFSKLQLQSISRGKTFIQPLINLYNDVQQFCIYNHCVFTL